jgi:hypothetical protein
MLFGAVPQFVPTPRPRNLWPQPNEVHLSDGTSVGSGAKVSLEDYLHSAVCAGAMPLADGQRLIAGDWVAMGGRGTTVGRPYHAVHGATPSLGC